MAVIISIGDYVGILDGTERGYVTKIEKEKAWIETKDGFEITSLISKLVKYNKTTKKNAALKKKINVGKSAETASENLEEFPGKKPSIKKVKDHNFKVNPSLIGEEKKYISKKQDQSIWEVDLHMEELTDDHRHLSNGEIVDLQLKHARSILEKAKRNKINKVIFIHGKGKGTLRQELLNLLAGYTYLEWYDASFKKYGGGATEVRIFINKV